MIKENKRKIIILKNAMRFIIELMFLCAIYVLGKMNITVIPIGIWNACFVLFAYQRMTSVLEKARKIMSYDKQELKGIYAVCIAFLLISICCSYNFDALESIKDDLMRLILTCVYDALQIIQIVLEVAMVKDVIFEIYGWNINKTFEEYWQALIENEKIYMLREDQYKALPRLWLIRGDACEDIVDYSQDALIHHFSNEYIKLTDAQAKELLRNREINDNEWCCYEGKSVSVWRPWKEKHFYDVQLIRMNLDYFKEEEIRKFIKKDRKKILLLPSEAKAKEKKIYKIVKKLQKR